MKQLALPLVAVAIVGLTACSGAAPASETPSVLIWVDATREPAAKAYADSVGDSVDVSIEVYDPADLKTKISLFNQTKSGWPDVVFAGNPNDVAELSDPSNAFAAALDDLVDSEVLEGYGTSNDWCIIDGTAYCLKNDLAQSVLWYDTVLFEELGLTVPTTMEEYAAEASKLSGSGYSAGALGDGAAIFYNYLQPSGCPLSDVEDRETVRIDPQAEECTRVAATLQPLLDAGVLDQRSNFDAGFIADVAKAGKLVMTIGPSWWGDFIMKPAETWGIPAGRLTAAAMPTWVEGDTNYSGAWGGGIYMVSSHAEFPQVAADAAVWLATENAYQETAPTFPAYGPANEAWGARISADDYYVEDVYPVLAEASTKISDTFAATRYDFDGQLAAVLGTQVAAGTSIEEALIATGDALASLAEGAGYTVVTN